MRSLFLILIFFATILSGQSQWKTATITGAIYGISLGSVTYGNNKYVAVGGESTILTSSDGISWTNNHLSYDSELPSLGNVIYGNNQYVAFGYSSVYSKDTILISSDGLSWTGRGLGTSYGTNYRYLSVVYGGGLYVAVGFNDTIPITIITSSDGLSWTKHNLGIMGRLISVAYGNSQFVAVGQKGKTFTSPDGISWTNRTSDPTIYFRRVAYGNGKFVATGYTASAPGYIFVSADGNSWTKYATDTTKDFNSITFGNGQFVVVGSGGITLTTSPDGISWTDRTSDSTIVFTDITYGNSQYVALGNKSGNPGSGIWTSVADSVSVLEQRQPMANAEFKLNISGSSLTAFLPPLFRDQAIKVAIFNIKGQKVRQFQVQSGSGRINVSIPRLASSLYNVSVQAKGARITKTIVVAH